MTAIVLSFPVRKNRVWIEPVENDGGAWGVFLQRIGHPVQLVVWNLAFDLSETDARAIARRYKADFLDDMPPSPSGAA